MPPAINRPPAKLPASHSYWERDAAFAKDCLEDARPRPGLWTRLTQSLNWATPVAPSNALERPWPTRAARLGGPVRLWKQEAGGAAPSPADAIYSATRWPGVAAAMASWAARAPRQVSSLMPIGHGAWAMVLQATLHQQKASGWQCQAFCVSDELPMTAQGQPCAAREDGGYHTWVAAYDHALLHAANEQKWPERGLLQRAMRALTGAPTITLHRPSRTALRRALHTFMHGSPMGVVTLQQADGEPPAFPAVSHFAILQVSERTVTLQPEGHTTALHLPRDGFADLVETLVYVQAAAVPAAIERAALLVARQQSELKAAAQQLFADLNGARPLNTQEADASYPAALLARVRIAQAQHRQAQLTLRRAQQDGLLQLELNRQTLVPQTQAHLTGQEWLLLLRHMLGECTCTTQGVRLKIFWQGNNRAMAWRWVRPNAWQLEWACGRSVTDSEPLKHIASLRMLFLEALLHAEEVSRDPARLHAATGLRAVISSSQSRGV